MQVLCPSFCFFLSNYTMFIPRRSARLLARNAYASTSASDALYNTACVLSNSRVSGCCYQQDKRPKSVSHQNKKYCDPVSNLPMMVKDTLYIDGDGYMVRGNLCFTRYCPSCANYWKERLGLDISGLPTYIV